LSLKEPKTLGQLDSLNIGYTFSQLKLLEQWDVIEKLEDDHYHTTIKMFDGINTKKLRAYSGLLASNLVKVIKKYGLIKKALITLLVFLANLNFLLDQNKHDRV